MRLWLIVLGFIATLILLAFGCYAAASDAQGAIVFIFVLPLCFGTIFLIWVTSKTLPIMRKTAAVFFIFFLLFFVTAFLPEKFSIPHYLISAVSHTFQSITGESPYSHQQHINDAHGAIDRLISEKSDGQLDLSKLELSQSWNSICILSAAMSDKDASHLLKRSDWQYSMYRENQNVDFTLVIMDGANIRYVVHLLKGQFDFSKYAGQCFSKQDAIFK